MGFVIPSLSDALRVWNLFNTDTFELVRGQFHPEDLTMDISTAWSEKFGLNREHPIVQFLHGEVETISFRSRLVATTLIEDLEDDLDKLKSFARYDESLGRPPILEFWFGSGSFNLFRQPCRLTGLNGISYKRPTFFGNLRHVEFTINLREIKEFSLEGPTIGNTRYHRAVEGDYYEYLTQREYNNPLLGDAIRKIHPDQPNIQTGDVIELPTASKLRKTKITQTSIALQDGFGRKESPQRSLRLAEFERHNRTKVSHVILEQI